jgi:hypothetical protein
MDENANIYNKVIKTEQKQSLLLSCAYGGSVRYYAAMMHAETVQIDADEAVKTGWCHNHCRIEGANGPLTLAIPTEKASWRTPMRELRISEHGDWRRIHWGAIFSAYGKTPYFDYIADDLHAIYDRGDHWLIDFDMALHELITDFAALPVTVRRSDAIIENNRLEIKDLRQRIGGKKIDNKTDISDVPYYQVWASRYGFIPDLSIIDLVMNMGRESWEILAKMLNSKLI